MSTRLFNISLVFLLCCVCVNGQAIKEKTMKLFDGDKKLVEATTETFNVKGKIVKSVVRNYRSGESVTITDYLYNENGQLIQEDFASLRPWRDSTKTKRWTDTNFTNRTFYTYNTAGLLKFKRTYGFECNLDTCDVTEYFYEGKLLKRKLITNHCSMKTDNYYYPVYYEYDKNDSLILEKAFGPSDTSTAWYAYVYDYGNWPDKFITEKYYRKDDSLQLESRHVTKTKYLADGRISRINYLEKLLSYEDFEYYTNNQLKSQVLVREGLQILKYIYHYNKYNIIARRETYSLDANDASNLKLYYYETYSYKYY